ncbi:MAG TPA: hypothetical protein VJ804_10995, partial [Acidimicrobiales bacterium]|nr:hypothetical protein [Acidimicrobiales bacterium]
AIRTSTTLVLAAPLPVDEDAWQAAAAALAAGDLSAYTAPATAMYAVAPHAASAIVRWWHASR